MPRNIQHQITFLKLNLNKFFAMFPELLGKWNSFINDPGVMSNNTGFEIKRALLCVTIFHSSNLLHHGTGTALNTFLMIASVVTACASAS